MKHKEWIGDKELILRLLENAGLVEDNDKLGMNRILMRDIIIYRYLKFMTVEEICANITFEHGVELSKTKYYRLFNMAIRLMEKHI